MFNFLVEQCVNDVWFVAWMDECIVGVDVVVFVCYVEDASECFAMCGVDVQFVLVDDEL
jgi:hypothetical protein